MIECNLVFILLLLSNCWFVGFDDGCWLCQDYWVVVMVFGYCFLLGEVFGIEIGWCQVEMISGVFFYDWLIVVVGIDEVDLVLFVGDQVVVWYI